MKISEQPYSLVCSSRQQDGERKCLPVVEVVFETMEGIVHFPIFLIQRYGCDMANPNHMADIYNVLKTIIFTPH